MLWVMQALQKITLANQPRKVAICDRGRRQAGPKGSIEKTAPGG